MKIIGRELATEKGYIAEANRCGGGVWVTWTRELGDMPEIAAVYDDEITALRVAVKAGASVAFLPFGQGRMYIHWADLEQLPQAEPTS